MESAETSTNPQTEKFVLWAVFFLFCAVLAFTLSTYSEETARLEALGLSERQKKSQLDALERQREQTARYIERMGRDPEFVQDQLTKTKAALAKNATSTGTTGAEPFDRMIREERQRLTPVIRSLGQIQ